MTGLPNLHRDDAAASTTCSPSTSGSLLAAVAVDSFREVNDTLGHQVGDDLLREVAAPAARSPRPAALIGRIGGGRFARRRARGPMAGGDAGAVRPAAARAGRGRRAARRRRDAHPAVGRLRPRARSTATTPPRCSAAPRRRCTAPGTRTAGPVLWEPAYEVQGQRRLAVVMALREALAPRGDRRGLPAQGVGAAPAQVTGVEALARWTHPALGQRSTRTSSCRWPRPPA